MATSGNIQVNANTSSAVGAFNALANAIQAAQAATSQLNTALNSPTTTQAQGKFQALTDQLSSFGEAGASAFERLTIFANQFLDLMGKVASGIEFVFNSIVEQMDKIQGFNAIMLVSTKSVDEANSAYTFLRTTADRLGVQFDSLALNFSKLAAAVPDSANKMELVEKVFTGVAEAARTLHASNQDTQLMFYAVTQMASKGVLSMEELRKQLGEKLPGAITIAANALNTTVPQMIQAISKGSVDSIKFLNYFGDELIRTFSDSSQKASTSVSASINRLTNVWTDFVKNILDSGAGQSIINIFDALREKLSDPVVINQFSETVKELADKITGFVTSLTSDDIRTGFDEFSKFVNVMTTALGKFIEGLTWLIDHAPQAGAVIGGIGGAMAGAQVGGPWGALAGGALGTVGGAYAGRAIAPDEGEKWFAQQMANQRADEQARQAQVDYGKAVIDFSNAAVKASDTVKATIDKDFPNQGNLTQQQAQDLTKILSSSEWKTDSQKSQAINDYSQTGKVLGPRAGGLSDVLNGQSKITPQERSENATWNKAMGYDADFDTQFQNLNNLLKEGRLNVDQYNDALAALFQKQPFYEQMTKAQTKAEQEYNQQLEDEIQSVIKQAEFKDRQSKQMQDELRMAGMRAEDLAVEKEVTAKVNDAAKQGIDISKEQVDLWTQQIYARNKLNELEKLGESIQAQTTDKYLNPLKQQQAMNRLTADPSSGFTKADQTDYTVTQDANMKGTDQYLDAQKKSLQAYYDWVDSLRLHDTINEQTAIQAKANAEAAYLTERYAATSKMFGDLATLSDSGNKELSRIGKAAAVAQAVMDGEVAIMKAWASAPWPANLPAVATTTIAEAVHVAKIAGIGFQSGGYTGDGAVDEVAGVVHGKEFVVHADATAKNRQALEAMNAGASVSSGGSSHVSVVVNNNAPNTTATAKQVNTPTGPEIQVMIEKAVSRDVKKGGRISQTLEAQYGLNRAAGTVK